MDCDLLELNKLANIMEQMRLHIQGGFFDCSAQKLTKCQITCKFLEKSSKYQNFQRVWHLVIFWAEQSKKPPCIIVRVLTTE